MKISIVIQFSQLYKEWKTRKLPIQTGYKLAKMAAAFETDLTYYTNRLNEILQEYGETDENGQLIYDDEGGIKVKEGQIKECQNALDELENFEVEAPVISFNIDELEPLDLTVEQISLFMPFIR